MKAAKDLIHSKNIDTKVLINSNYYNCKIIWNQANQLIKGSRQSISGLADSKVNQQ